MVTLKLRTLKNTRRMAANTEFSVEVDEEGIIKDRFWRRRFYDKDFEKEPLIEIVTDKADKKLKNPNPLKES